LIAPFGIGSVQEPLTAVHEKADRNAAVNGVLNRRIPMGLSRRPEPGFDKNNFKVTQN